MHTAHPRWPRTLQAVAGTQIAVLIGFGFSFPFLPLLIQELGVTERSEVALWTGLVVGASGIAMSIAAPIWGVLADRFGRKPMLVRAIAAGSILLTVQAAVTNVWQLATLRILNGVFTGTQTAGAMLIAGIVPRERTGYALGILNTSVQMGNLAGPLIGGIAVATLGLRESFLVGGVILAISTVVTIALVEDVPVAPRISHDGARGVARDIVTPFRWTGLRGVLIVGSLVQIMSSGTVALVAIYMQDLARPTWLTLELTIGLALAIGGLAAALAMPILGGWADRHDSRVLLAASLAVLGVSLVPQALTSSAVVFLALRVLVGVGLAGTTSSIAVLTRSAAPAGGEGRAFGALAAAQNFGWGIGPLAGSAFAAAAGIPALYIVAGVALLALAPVALTHSWFTGRAAEPLDVIGG
jgi:DHA1 family multidrug resistance protein-like MFS transporter